MSDDLALSAANYQPPAAVTANTDIEAQVAAAVRAALAQQLAALNVPQPAPELSPEEKVRKAIDNRGVGLGIEETKAELYEVLHHLAQKLGV